MTNVAIKLSNLSYSYKNSTEFALKDFNLEVPTNSCTLILGPNGAGKSTLMSLICGLIEFQSGDIKINKNWSSDYYSYATQNCALYEDLSIRENLELFAQLMSHSSLALEKIEEVASSLDLRGHLDKKIAHCSGGLKQRAHIASTLLGKYPLLVLDEPFNNIDPESRLLISESLKKYCAQNNATLLISSHQFEAMEGLWTHLAFIKKGQLSEFITRDNSNDQKLQTLFFELKNSGELPK